MFAGKLNRKLNLLGQFLSHCLQGFDLGEEILFSEGKIFIPCVASKRSQHEKHRTKIHSVSRILGRVETVSVCCLTESAAQAFFSELAISR